ncbi:MAG: hypothetical protein QXF41_02040 [Candidatus Micrarchaeaceae archaeon]
MNDKSMLQVTKNFSRALAVRLYLKERVPSHIIVLAFRAGDLPPISTKTIIKLARENGDGYGIRGYDMIRKKQLYNWIKTTSGPYKKWRLTGKVPTKMYGIIAAFWAWIYYFRRFGLFDLDAVVRGQPPIL